MPDDVRQMLLSAGLSMDELTPQQRELLLGLRQDEVALLVEISQRLEDTEPDVVAHESALVGGLLF